MSNQPHISDADVHGWAADKLGLPADSPADKVREVFLRSLRDDGFVPPPQVQEAFQILQQRDRPVPQVVTEFPVFEIEDRLRNEVEAFAFEFFLLSFEQRQERLQSLAERCAWNAPLAAWLRRFRKALFLDPYAIEASTHVRLLAQMIGELYVFPPAARVVQRTIMVRRLARERRTWSRAAAALRRDFPKIAALESRLIDELAAEQGSAAPERSERHGARGEQMPHPSTLGPRPSRASAWWLVWLGVFILVGIFRAASTSSNRSALPPVNIPKVDFRPQQQQNLDELRRWLDERQRQQFAPPQRFEPVGPLIPQPNHPMR